MFQTNLIGGTRRKRFVASATAFAVAVATLAGVYSATAANAAPALATADECVTRANSRITDLNTNRTYLTRHCYLEADVAAVYGGDNAEAAAAADLVGSINAGITPVYCQELGSDKRWRGLIEVDEVADGVDTDSWNGAWLPVQHFAQANGPSSRQPLPGVPDCAKAAEWTDADLTDNDTVAEGQGVNAPSSTGSNGNTTSALTCEKQNEKFIDVNSGEEFDQSYTCETSTIADVFSPKQDGTYSKVGRVDQGESVTVACYSSSLSRTISGGYYFVLAKADDVTGFMNSEAIGGRANQVPSGLEECGETSKWGKRIIAAQNETGVGANKCEVSTVRFATTTGHRPTVECDVRSASNLVQSENGQTVGSVPAGKYSFICQAQAKRTVGSINTGEWWLYTRLNPANRSQLTNSNDWGYIPGTSVVESSGAGKVAGVPVCTTPSGAFATA